MKKALLIGMILVLGLATVVSAQTDTTIVTLQVTGTRSVSIAETHSVTAVRGATGTSVAAMTLTYSTDYASDKITVVGANSSGTETANVAVNIKGGDIGSYASGSLFSSGTYQTALTLKTISGAADALTIDDISFELDATAVAAGDIGAAWEMLVTYTILAQ